MSTTTCYACGHPTVLKCMSPNCSHYFCSNHGDFICADCHQNTHQQQATKAKRQETQQKVVGGIIGILIAVFIGFITICWEIVKAVLRGL
jgi:hypothetical protein